MSMFTKSELEFLKLLENDKFFVTESSDKDRRKVLDKTVSILRDLGYDPKISKKSEDKWIATNNSGDLGGESLCISIGKLKGLDKVCSAVNKEIKPQAKLSPDNYGTVFLSMKESVVTESYLGNYIRNKIYLSKMGKNPDLNRRTIISFIKKMETHYETSLLDEEVKDLMKKRNVGDYYLPKGSMTFPDGKEITFAFCYDKSSFTPGAAMKTEDGSYVILLYPKFFECEDMEDKIFTVMHEIGHVRLGHLEHRNQSIDMNRREHQMVKGRAIYPELNADLYAVLNGAKMYTILSYTDARDYNKKYDYRYSNNEIALRYGFVFKNYKKYGKMYESSMMEGVLDKGSVGTKSGTLTSITGEFNVEEVYFSKYNDKDYAYVKVEGDDRPLRGRSEVIIMKDDEIFLCFKDNGKYRLPGGGWDKLESYEHAAIREAKEEARILCDDVEYAICRVDWEDKVPDKCFKENIPEEGYWYGWFTKVYVARYSGKYNGHIDKEDQDKDMASNGKFYKYSEVKDILYPDHKIAIEKYLQSSLNVMEKTDSKNDDPKQKMLDEFKHYVKWCTMDDGSFMAIRPLKNYMIHNSKKQGDMLLLATLCSLPKDKVKHILECLHNNVRFNDERVDFHTCYLPGDVFIYILLSDVKKESVEEFYEEFCIEDPFGEVDEFYLEASDDSNTHIILEEIYPNIEEVLSTREGDKLFKRYVEDFVDRNTEKLHEPCPISMIAFTDYDKAKFYQLFKFEEKELIKIVTKAVNAVSSSAQFKLVKQNPIFSVFYCVLRYYILKNDVAGINTTLIIHALASYPSVFSKYFKYGANPGVMKYTADHLTEKFIFKQEKHVFGALKKSIDSAYKFLKPYFKEAPDKEIIRYIQRIRNDQNSMIKKIAIEYNKNYNAGKTVSTQSETYDTGALIDEYNNDTSKVETLAQKVVINILTNGIDLRILETAGAMAQLSVTELRLYLTKILIDSRSTELEEFVNSVLFIYLFDEKHEIHEIRSRVFLSFGIELFRKTNSNNKNIVTIKSTLDKWAEETGIHSRYRREPTRISYKKGIYWYILLTIQMNV